MRTFNASDIRETKQTDYSLPARCRCSVALRAGEDCTITAATSEGELIEIAKIRPATKIVERFELNGYDKLMVTALSPNKSVAPLVNIRSVELEEPHDNLPVPEKPAPKSILQQIRNTVRAEMMRGRENFLENNTGLNGYEIDDDDDGLHPSDALAALAAGDRTGTDDTGPAPDSMPDSPGDDSPGDSNGNDNKDS